MIQIRNSVFETNSSSTHSLTIWLGEKIILDTDFNEEDEDDIEITLDYDLDKVLEAIPTNKLLEELKKRQT